MRRRRVLNLPQNIHLSAVFFIHYIVLPGHLSQSNFFEGDVTIDQRAIAQTGLKLHVVNTTNTKVLCL